jgi:hypothetical protein
MNLRFLVASDRAAFFAVSGNKACVGAAVPRLDLRKASGLLYSRIGDLTSNHRTLRCAFAAFRF